MTSTQSFDAQSASAVITTAAPLIDDTRRPLSSQPNLWERIAIAVRAKGYSLSTERTYVDWAKRFVKFHGRRHPSKMGAAEVQRCVHLGKRRSGSRTYAGNRAHPARGGMRARSRRTASSTCSTVAPGQRHNGPQA